MRTILRTITIIIYLGVIILSLCRLVGREEDLGAGRFYIYLK